MATARYPIDSRSLPFCVYGPLSKYKFIISKNTNSLCNIKIYSNIFYFTYVIYVYILIYINVMHLYYMNIYKYIDKYIFIYNVVMCACVCARTHFANLRRIITSERIYSDLKKLTMN